MSGADRAGFPPDSVSSLSGATEANAEALPFADKSFDAYTIAFGIRNVPRRQKALEEAYRVLKRGGRFLCLEFSDVDIPVMDSVYRSYSFTAIPAMGKAITGDGEPYRYLVESIAQFPPADEFREEIAAAGFRRASYTKLTGGVAVISVGASTEAEMKQTKARMEDALHATRAAVEEGILPGGGVALLRAIDDVNKVKVSGDEAIGVGIVARALEAPARMIATNCGKDGAVIVDEVRQLKGPMGYDAAKDAYVDMLAAGILDPTKVVRNALSNAASIAGLMLTTQVLVTKSEDAEGGKKPASEGVIR